MEEMMESSLAETVERMNAAAAALEQAARFLVEKHEAMESAANECVEIVATATSKREAELEGKLAEAEKAIAELKASAVSGGRKTAIAATMQAKAVEANDAQALDAALASLSLEQRIAVKSEMLRAGLVR